MSGMQSSRSGIAANVVLKLLRMLGADSCEDVHGASR